jgi:transcriptional regulator with GAF, ATPase, and Fis domain
MSNKVDENPQSLVTENEQLQRSSPTRRVAADQSDLELAERSQAFIEIMKQVDGVSNSNLPVLLLGAPGTGKQLVACAIHQRSPRSEQPLVTVNCATLPPNAIDAALFGADPPDPDRRGAWEQADGGTLFLDEITETDASLQAKLLRALQTGEITRQGSDEPKQVNVRVIAASSHNVEEEVAAGRFSEDLFNALRSLSIVLPPLRKSQLKDADHLQPLVEDWVTLSEIEGRYVARVLTYTGGNKQAAARLLSVDRKTLDRMIKRHHITYPHTRHRPKASASP